MITDNDLAEVNKRMTWKELSPMVRLTLVCHDCNSLNFKAFLTDFGIAIVCANCRRVETSLTPDALKYMVEALEEKKQ